MKRQQQQPKISSFFNKKAKTAAPAPAPAAAAAPADPRLRVGRAVRKKFTGSGWFDGSVTSIADGTFEVRWSDGDETSYPFKAATKMLDAAEGTAVAPVAAAVAAPVVE